MTKLGKLPKGPPANSTPASRTQGDRYIVHKSRMFKDLWRIEDTLTGEPLHIWYATKQDAIEHADELNAP